MQTGEVLVEDSPAWSECIVDVGMYDDNCEQVGKSAVSPRTGCYMAMGKHS